MELDNATKENIEKMIGENDVFLFMKGNLGNVTSVIINSIYLIQLPT